MNVKKFYIVLLNFIIMLMICIILIKTQSCNSIVPKKNSDCWKYHSPSSACCFVESYYKENYSTTPSTVKCQSFIPQLSITESSYDELSGSTTFKDCRTYNYSTDISCGSVGTNPSLAKCKLMTTSDSICCHLKEVRIGGTSRNQCFLSGGLIEQSYVNTFGSTTYYVTCLLK